MTYGEAKQRLLNPHDGEDDRDYRKERVAQNVVVLSCAENLERIANALTKIAEKMEKS